MKTTYYTCFKFSDYEPKDLHCTHKYLGEITNEQLDEVISKIDHYFLNRKIHPFSILFDQEDYFGLNHQIRVLRTKSDLYPFMMDLKSSLDSYRKDPHDTYNPHVTTVDRDMVSNKIESYVLVKNGKIFKEWKFNSK